MSGVASIGRRWKLHTPMPHRTTTTQSTAQRKRMEPARMRSSKPGRSGLRVSVVMACPRLLDVGTDQECAFGDIFGARLKAAQHFSPFRRAAPNLQHSHLIGVADLGIDDLEVAETL